MPKGLLALLAAALIAIVAMPARAHAFELHVGPLLGFEAYSRRSPEPTDSIRFTLGFGGQAKYLDGWPMFDFAALAVRGTDEFASQNSIDETLYRFRWGFIVEPFNIEALTLGLRFGGEYGMGTADYFIRFPLSTDHINPSYLSPYLGFVVSVTPISGFGVSETFTATYDTYLDCWVYQVLFGVSIL